jgi:hypothetical protein
VREHRARIDNEAPGTPEEKMVMAKKTQPQPTVKKTTKLRPVAPAPTPSRASAPARSANGTQYGTSADPRDLVALRAYQIYLERGGGHGRDLEDWLQAEREVAC